MKDIILFIAILFVFVACKKQHNNGCSPVTPASEATSITSFCDAHGMAYTVDSNGIYYQVIDPGSGPQANMNSLITATYSTTLLSGEIVDTSHLVTPVTLPLSSFIEGWRIAIPYIQEGGHMKMIIPSSLAYGCTGIQGLVPSNAPLYYDIILLEVSN